MPLAEGIIMKVASREQENFNPSLRGSFTGGLSCTHKQNTSIMTARGDTANNQTENKFRVSFTNFAFVQDLKSS